MCWTQRWSPAAHALCSIAYICAGAVQLVAGVFFLISLPVFKLGSNIWTGAWNIVIGIGAAMLACIGDLTPKKQESLLYFAISILAFNAVNLVVLEVGEWNLFLTEDVSKLISQNNLRKLIFYARITTSISSALAVITSFFDTQFTYCSMQRRQKPKNVHEQVSDIEYIIPRKKTSSVAKQAQNIYSQYAQSWVFDTDTTSSSKNESPYLKLPNNNVPYDTKTFSSRKHSTPKIDIICDEQNLDQKMFLVNPTVHVEPVSDDSNGGRSLNYMKSFSRTPSPAGVSESSSQDSSFNPPIYECLERLTEPTLYRSRLNTAISLNAEQSRQSLECDARGTLDHAKSSHSLRPRSDTFSKAAAVEVLHVPEKVQYASLMVELQQAIRSKKERLHQQQPVSPQSTCDSVAVEDCSEPTQTESKGSNSLQGSSLDNSQRTEPKGSDTEFSKELEAALQLIQDLESPNTIETPSETCRSINGAELALPGGSAPVVRVKWRDSDASGSGSTKTLSECVSPPELPADSSQGKATSVVVVASAGSGSQSSSGYSSPSHGNSKQPTPTCSKPPSVTGSSGSLVGGAEQQVSYAICNTSGAAIISLYSPAGTTEAPAPEKKKRTPPPPPKIEVKEAPEPRKCSVGDSVAGKTEAPSRLSPVSAGSRENVVLRDGKDKPPVRASSVPNGSSSIPEFKLESSASPASTLRASTSKWNVKSLLRKKTSPPMLTPELEGAIFKSESLAYLTELELLARHARNKSIQRQIEQRVQQQILGHSSSESHC
ncbi:uncharacterized protein LOC124610325 isoform X1 [Schistocerca americana]|uniref:uncharacterized protein LOC124610325 isoform X1 n=2 Tax=Schistocerca americana TaxID=7009 RepID=UPI001F5034BE|nr:uncharacterized protein LOC124610325 isoform X1 [Schistocerca americana]XP_046996106.1 uncharacterized protein LOC124610325 isoform X1 [Schistocerca americana]